MRSAGDDLIEVPADCPRNAEALAASLRESGRWLEAVAGIDSVVVRFDLLTMNRSEAEKCLTETLEKPIELTPGHGPSIEIPIVYGGEYGPDFDDVCDELCLTADELINLHCGEYTVDMLGYVPGFAYVGGLDARLSIGRLPEPRQRVPAGSVGITGGRTGLYSLQGPGGWPLIGRTSVNLFDSEADEPFTLFPGARVVFTAANKL